MTTTEKTSSQRTARRNYFRLLRLLRAYILDDPAGLKRMWTGNDCRLPVTPEKPLPLTPAPLPPTPDVPASNATSELASIASKCRVKANGCTWASERQRLQESGAEHQIEIAPNDAAITNQGKQHEVFLWMNTPSAPVPDDPGNFDMLAGCYGALSNAAELLSLVESSDSARKSYLEGAMALMAEAQSMVRSCSENIGGPRDTEQLAAYSWLLQRAKETGIFIERYMRVDDPASPEQWHKLITRIEDFETDVRQLIKKERSQRKLLGKLKYKLRQLEQTNDVHGEIAGIDRTVNELVESGLPPSNVQLRELLLPYLTLINETEQKSPGLDLTLREINRVIDTSAEPKRAIPQNAPSKEVTEVANLLQGRSIALIGGDFRPETKQSIEDAFGLDELVWVDTKHGQSYQAFRPVVERNDVALVLLAIRWVAHSHSGVKRFCKDMQTPLVRLPAGLNPNQIAAAILDQCGDRLLTLNNGDASGS